MVGWLRDTIEELQSHDGTFNILQSVMILLMVICRLELLGTKFLEDKHHRVLFKGLCTIPELTDTGDWLDLIPIKESFLKDDRLKAEFVPFLKRIHRTSHDRKNPMIEVIFSFPMLHFAEGLWTPFKPITDFVHFDSSRKAALDHFKKTTTNWYVC